MTYYARSRFAPKHAAPTTGAAAPVGRTVEEALANNEAVVMRIRTGWDRRGIRWHELRAYNDEYRVIEFDDTNAALDNTIRLELIRMMFELFPNVDWTRDHDVHVLTGQVYRAPDIGDLGGMPDEDRTFGELRPPVLLAAGAAV